MLRALAGHADLATTQRYIDLDADDHRKTIALFDVSAGQQPGEPGNPDERGNTGATAAEAQKSDPKKG